jgi:hypothetical protein
MHISLNQTGVYISSLCPSPPMNKYLQRPHSQPNALQSTPNLHPPLHNLPYRLFRIPPPQKLLLGGIPPLIRILPAHQDFCELRIPQPLFGTIRHVQRIAITRRGALDRLGARFARELI